MLASPKMVYGPRDLASLVNSVDRDGYVVIPDAIEAAELTPIVHRYDELMQLEIEAARARNPEPRHIEIKRILEKDPIFAPLMTWPTVFPLATALIGRDITLATGGEGDYRPPRTLAHIGWHNDFAWMENVPYPRQNFWVRCTYFLEDVDAGMGPLTLLPGSHREVKAPEGFNDDNGQPKNIPGQVGIVGSAGTCLVNNTEIWHTATPNRSDRPRKLIMILYKHAWMQQWQDGYQISPEFAASQSDPIRKQLCGVGVWHRFDRTWAVS